MESNLDTNSKLLKHSFAFRKKNDTFVHRYGKAPG